MLSRRIARVVGRDRELDAITSALDNAPAPVIVLEGEAGIGKTTLWRAGVDAARARGYRVLACVAAGSETQLSLTTVRDLIAEAFPEIAEELPPPQRRALEVALLLTEPDREPPTRETIAVAFLTALRLLAARAPLLIAVDDVQWVDRASAGVLEYGLRRLNGEPIAALLARRSGHRDALALAGFDRERVRVVGLGMVSVGALGRILHDSLGIAYPRPLLHRVHEVSGGNPLYALELARALAGADTDVRAGEALPVPGSLRELVSDRLAALPAETFDALVVASALSRPTLQLLGSALGVDAASLLGPAVAARVVDVEGKDVRFVHPLFGAVVYESASPRRRPLHAQLAEVIEDVEERARHLALSAEEPNEAVAQSVEDGATAAFARGSPAAAAELAAQALRLTPAQRSGDARRRAVAKVDYDFASGDTERASALLEALLAQTPPGTAHARLLSRQARLQHFGRDIRTSVALLRQALSEAGDDDALRGEVEEGLAWGLLLLREDLDAAARHAASAASLAEARADPAALAEGLAAHALIQFVLGRPWREPMARALELEHAVLDLRVLRHPSFAYGYCLSCSDELDAARGVFEDLLARAAEHGDESSVPSILNHLTLIELLAGRWGESAAHADEGYARAVESGQRPTQASILGKRALLAARRGATDEARETARRALGAEGDDVDLTRPDAAMASGGETAVWTLGFLELVDGNPDAAHRFLGPLTEALLATGIQEPGEIRCLSDEIEALVALDRLGEADALLVRLEAWARMLERPSTLGGAGRCRGLLLAARGDSEAALGALEQAAEAYERSLLPFERAQALLALGTQRRRARQRRAARESLQAALAIFTELGAELWAEKAEAELGRIGGRAPAPGELTPSERRIAALVAEGKTNREVAAALVVAERTVESTLTQIYRKLRVRSRTELARKLTGSD